MLVGIWRNDDLHLFPRWTSTLAVLTMQAFWPLFFPFIVSSKWCLFGEITFALNWEPLIKSFLKEIGTKRTLSHNGSSLPLSSLSLDDPPDIGTATKKCWGVFFFLVVCVNEREWVVIYRLRGGNSRPLNVPCQRSVCLFTSALRSNSHKMDGGDGVELCLLACQYCVSEVINQCCPCNWKVYFHCLKSLYSFTVTWKA